MIISAVQVIYTLTHYLIHVTTLEDNKNKFYLEPRLGRPGEPSRENDRIKWIRPAVLK